MIKSYIGFRNIRYSHIISELWLDPKRFHALMIFLNFIFLGWRAEVDRRWFSIFKTESSKQAS